MEKSKKWEDVRKELQIDPIQEAEIQLEIDLIEAEIQARKNQNITQEVLSEKSGIKQPAIARFESRRHSPTVSTLIKLLYPLGYTLRIMPIEKNKTK